MKNTLKITIAAVAITLFTSNVSMAGFLMKKEKAPVTVVASGSAAKADESATFYGNEEAAAPAEHIVKEVKKQSFFSKIYHKVKNAIEEAAVPQWAYIVLSIIGLGWLAMGINDNFEGTDWLISLILSLIFWLPGVIYSLIKMKNYY